MGDTCEYRTVVVEHRVPRNHWRLQHTGLPVGCAAVDACGHFARIVTLFRALLCLGRRLASVSAGRKKRSGVLLVLRVGVTSNTQRLPRRMSVPVGP